MRATQAIVNLQTFAANLVAIRRILAPTVHLCVPVKADAYGHGAVPCAQTAVASGADCLGVATVAEGQELRASGISVPVLLFSAALPDEYAALVHSALTPFVGDKAALTALSAEAARQGVVLDVHLKIDTGMGRAGCRPDEALTLAQTIAGDRHLRLAGMCTHFAVSDSSDAGACAYTARQFAAFIRAVAAVRDAGIDAGLAHAAASGGVLLHPDTHLDMVRPGILAYGYAPAASLASEAAALGVRPVLTLVSALTVVKTIAAGESVSYGCTWTATHDTRVGIVPMGYADGLLRRFSPGAAVSVRGVRAPVIGRICMDACMVSLDDVPQARVGERVVFDDAAVLAGVGGTIPYEVLCGISRRVPRIYSLS